MLMVVEDMLSAFNRSEPQGIEPWIKGETFSVDSSQHHVHS